MLEVIVAAINNPLTWMYGILGVSAVYTVATARQFKNFWKERYTA